MKKDFESRRRLALSLAQGLLILGALVLLAWVPVPGWLLGAAGCVGFGAIVGRSVRPNARPVYARGAAVLAWCGTGGIFSGLCFVGGFISILDRYYAICAWLLAFGALLNAGPGRLSWKLLASTWAFAGVLDWVAATYSKDLGLPFFEGLFLLVVLLLFHKRAYRLPGWGVMAVNSLILLLIFLPLADWVVRPAKTGLPGPQAAGDAYRYEVGKSNLRAFRTWWGHYVAQLEQLARRCYLPDPSGRLPFRLRPNSRATLFEGRIAINSRGFRGKEFPLDKGRAFRIVALGESTTFGYTITPKHRPWPELLEKKIARELKPERPVEVINAGVPMYSLKDNLARFATDILPLKPDVVISYHGWNGFRFFANTLSPAVGGHLPVFKPRPLRLLAECEYKIKILLRRRQLIRALVDKPPVSGALKETRYGVLYEQLVRETQAHHIRLVLANYSMALNSKSDAAVVEFYRQIFPAIYWQIKANELHSKLVREIAEEHPEILFVDTHPGLDGQYEKFLDVMHFDAEGDRQMADTMFRAIQPLLERELRPERAR